MGRIPVDSARLLERFLNYVRIDTMANADSEAYPSSPGQLELGRLLAAELSAMGADQVDHDAHGLVWATIPATGRLAHEAAPAAIAWNAHLDTSPETSGANVRPQVIRDYAGGDLVLPAAPQRVIRVADNPELQSLHGHTLITTDGTTLLGADDKAGLAVIMEAAQYLLAHPEIPHGPIRILFTCDEEIGRGVDHVDLPRLNAVAAYTLDGPGAGQIDVETFSADLAVVVIEGVNIHPSIAKNRMVNAVRVAAEFLRHLPRHELAPETTSDRHGFLHPYVIRGGVDRVEIQILLRDFDTPRLAYYARHLNDWARQTQQTWPGSQITVTTRPQYRNLGDGLARHPHVVQYAQTAFERMGVAATTSIIRGGTDGSRMTELGLPTPNLSTGQHNPHSPLEWACLEEMETAVRQLVELAQVWGGHQSG
ncbi:MAG: peptidase T [Pirellulales bacterium]